MPRKTKIELTPYQKWYKSWKPLSDIGRASKRHTKVWNWPPCQAPIPNNGKPIQDLRLELEADQAFTEQLIELAEARKITQLAA